MVPTLSMFRDQASFLLPMNFFLSEPLHSRHSCPFQRKNHDLPLSGQCRALVHLVLPDPRRGVSPSSIKEVIDLRPSPFLVNSRDRLESIDGNCLARDKVRLGTRQERNHLADVFGRAKAPKANPFRNLISQSLGSQLSFDGARTYCIHSDGWPQFFRK